jgi:hypothetical protein
LHANPFICEVEQQQVSGGPSILEELSSDLPQEDALAYLPRPEQKQCATPLQIGQPGSHDFEHIAAPWKRASPRQVPGCPPRVLSVERLQRFR